MLHKSHTEFEMFEIFLCLFKPWVLSHYSNGENGMAVSARILPGLF